MEIDISRPEEEVRVANDFVRDQDGRLVKLLIETAQSAGDRDGRPTDGRILETREVTSDVAEDASATMEAHSNVQEWESAACFKAKLEAEEVRDGDEDLEGGAASERRVVLVFEVLLLFEVTFILLGFDGGSGSLAFFHLLHTPSP